MKSELGPWNARVREAAKLAQKKFRRQHGRLLLEGARLLADALDAGVTIDDLFVTSSFADTAAAPELLKRARAPVTRITEQAARKLCDTQHPQGIFAVARFAPADLEAVLLASHALVLVADGISDPGNLGTIIRSAAALGAACVAATGSSCDITNPKVVRATMGALFRVPVVEHASLQQAVQHFRSAGLQVVAAVARGGVPPWELDLRRGTALVIGSEADGLPEDLVRAADARSTVPMGAGAESLNAAVAAAVLLCDAVRQRGALTR